MRGKRKRAERVKGRERCEEGRRREDEGGKEVKERVSGKKRERKGD